MKRHSRGFFNDSDLFPCCSRGQFDRFVFQNFVEIQIDHKGVALIVAVETCGIRFKLRIEILTVGDSFDFLTGFDVNGGAGKGVDLVGSVDVVDDVPLSGSVIFGRASHEKRVAEGDAVLVFIFAGDSDEAVGKIFGIKGISHRDIIGGVQFPGQGKSGSQVDEKLFFLFTDFHFERLEFGNVKKLFGLLGDRTRPHEHDIQIGDPGKNSMKLRFAVIDHGRAGLETEGVGIGDKSWEFHVGSVLFLQFGRMSIDHAVFGTPFRKRFFAGSIFYRLDNMIGVEHIMNEYKVNETAFCFLFVRDRGDTVCQQLPAGDSVQRVKLAVSGTFERKGSVFVGQGSQSVTEKTGTAGAGVAFRVNENVVFICDLHDDMENAVLLFDHAAQIGKSQTVCRNVETAQMKRTVVAAQGSIAPQRSGCGIIVSCSVERYSLLVICNGSSLFDQVGFFIDIPPVVDDDVLCGRIAAADKEIISVPVNGDGFTAPENCDAE